MPKERSFSNKIIWDDPDIIEIKRRLDFIDQANYPNTYSSNFDDLYGDQNPTPIPTPPVPPVPPTPIVLPYPWPISIKSTEYTSDALGNPAANVTITWTDVPGANGYQVRVTKL